MPLKTMINYGLSLLGGATGQRFGSWGGRPPLQGSDAEWAIASANADANGAGSTDATTTKLNDETALLNTTQAVPSSVNVAAGATVEIAGPTTKTVTFAGQTGVLVIDHAAAFDAEVVGLSGTDTLDLADMKFTSAAQATFLGDADGGTLTVTNGSQTVDIKLVGDYLSSEWTVSDDGAGGVSVVDPTVSTNWQTLKVGAGGFVDGLDIAPDGTMVGRTDTNGAYLWNGSSWQQLVTASSMPASFVSANPVSSGQGVYEIQMAPSNSSVMYMMFDGYVFKSTNEGTSWTQTSFKQVTASPNDNFRTNGQKMAVDPSNPNIVYVGTPQNGLFVSRDGGTTWSNVAAVPVSAMTSGQYTGLSGIVFDPALGGVVNGVTQTIFASSYGNGVYVSKDGGSTWTSLNGGPSDVESAAVSANGAYYAVGSGNSALWVYANGAWANLLNAPDVGINSVAINPNNPYEIVVVSPADSMDVSYDGGQTWSGWDQGNSLSTNDIPWLEGANMGGQYAFLTIGGVAFSPTNPNQLIASAGTGVWNVDVPTSGMSPTTSLTWTDMSTGIENLVAVEALAPPGGDLVLASWDRPFFYIDDLNAYPSVYGPVESTQMVAGWSLDYASSESSFVVGIADFWGVEESGYSTDGGKTWTSFATELSGGGSSFIGGSISASTTTNFIWAPAGGIDPYYTLDGGKSWTQITLPGVTNWSSFDWAYYLNTRTVTADRVLSNTFYLYYNGVYETTNGGVSWTQVYGSQLGAYGANSEIMAAPGQAGTLFYTGGIQGDGTNPTSDYGFYMSTDQGHTWQTIANVQEVTTFGFGAAAPGTNNASLYIVGYVNDVYGVWASTNLGQSWVQIGTQPTGELDQITTITGDGDVYGQVYVGFAGGGYAYLSAGTGSGTTSVAPTVTKVVASPSSLLGIPGEKITFTVTMSEAVTISGGSPTLALNDGGVANYTSGSGTNTLLFIYTVAPTDLDVAALVVTGMTLNGAQIADASGALADLTGVATTFSNIAIDPPKVASLTETATKTVLGVGGNVTLDLTFTDPVTVSGGVPTLTLNDGGTATYVSGSGTSDLRFSYTAKATDSYVSSLQASSLNLNGATIANGIGATASTLLANITQTGPAIDPTTPAISSITDSQTSGSLTLGKSVTVTLKFNDAVSVVGGSPTLAMTDGGTAVYAGGSGTNALTFTYTVAVTDSAVSSLAVSSVALNGATIENAAGTNALLTVANLAQSGPSTSSGLVLGSGTYSISNEGLAVAANAKVAIIGANDLVAAAANAATISIGGNGASGAADSVYASGDKITVQANADVALYGASNTVSIGANSSLTVNGNGEKVSGTSDLVTISGGVGTTFSGTRTEIDLNGVGAAATVAGSNDYVKMNATGQTLTIGGNGANGLEDAVIASGDTVSLGANSFLGLDGANDAISVGAGSDLSLYGTNDTVTLGAGDKLWLANAFQSTLRIGANSGTVEAFSPGNNDVFDLINGAGGYHSTADVMNALHSDGQGGTILSLGSNSTLHILSEVPSQLTAAMFRIG